jgi:hydrogenase expression/formation protein HypD
MAPFAGETGSTHLLQRLAQVGKKLRRPLRLLEVAGTRALRATNLSVNGSMPGQLSVLSCLSCPAAVSDMSEIAQLAQLMDRPNVVICGYEDILNIPGCRGLSLQNSKKSPGCVLSVNSPLEVIDLAAANPQTQYVFAAFGFESTTPHTAVAILEAHVRQLSNFSIFVGHRLVIPALLSVLGNSDTKIDGILCNDALPVILGINSFRRVVSRFSIPCVVGGFEEGAVLETIVTLAELAAKREGKLVNLSPKAITDWGNRRAQNLIHAVFTNSDAAWRGLGTIPHSGQILRRQFRGYDARVRFALQPVVVDDMSACQCGNVLSARSRPGECALFASACSPDSPAGPCMASEDGACNVWYRVQNEKRRNSAGE